MTDYKFINKCLVCNNPTRELLDLGTQPLANDYHLPSEQLSKYPLCLHLCSNCFHIQLNCIVNPDILFKNYLYVSGTSDTNKKYFEWFAKHTLTHCKEDTVKILDIACNDGSQLNAFKTIAKELGKNIITIGIDPAENLYNISSKNGNIIYPKYFNKVLAQEIHDTHGVINIIIAQNVFAHINYPHEFLQACKMLMDTDSLLYIQTSQAKMIERGEFDTVYHEHLSFFNTNSMNTLCKTNKIHLNTINYVPIHGTSYLFEIKLKESDNSNLYEQLLTELIELNLYDNLTYTIYRYKCEQYKHNLLSVLLEYKINNWKIIGYGSTAKFNTILNACNITTDLINIIIDENTLKQHKLAPGSNIPITDMKYLDNIDDKTLIVISAWNFYDEIKEKIKNKTNKQIVILTLIL